jgi:hypothetical protein
MGVRSSASVITLMVLFRTAREVLLLPRLVPAIRISAVNKRFRAKHPLVLGEGIQNMHLCISTGIKMQALDEFLFFRWRHLLLSDNLLKKQIILNSRRQQVVINARLIYPARAGEYW